MIFGYVGICYKEAPLALRGQVALPDSKKIELGSGFLSLA